MTDFRFHKELHLTATDIEEMPESKRIFYIFLLQQMDDEKEKQQRELKKQQEQMKARSRPRRR